MKSLSLTLAAALSALALLGAAHAQDTSMEGHDMGASMELPEICRTGEAPAMAGMENMDAMMEGMGEAQRSMMQGMMAMHDSMMQGMTAEDPDVAFACAMIPHHQGAISMAEAELQHGDAEPMKQMAQMIIDAQKREIAELTSWLEQQEAQ